MNWKRSPSRFSGGRGRNNPPSSKEAEAVKQIARLKMTKKSRAGRAFEELIARIERTLAPRGAVVKSPDYIRDLVTNQRREVDASIRVSDGDEARLITVECRDHRKGRQDDRWIEQLITKREKIGAWRTIAVSSSGFSGPAVVTARHYGVELRQMDHITDAEIAQEWASGFQMDLLVLEYSVLDITIVDTNGMVIPLDKLPAELFGSLQADPVNTDFLRKRDDDILLSAAHIADLVGTPQNLQEDGEPVRARGAVDFNNGDWFVETVDGERRVSRVAVVYEFAIRKIPAPIQSVQQYSSPDKPLLELVRSSVRVDDRTTINLESSVSLNKPLPVQDSRRQRSRKKKNVNA